MTGPARMCPNGHPATNAEEMFCGVCGGPFAAPAWPNQAPQTPAAGAWPTQGQQPAPSPAAPPPAWGGPQGQPPAWGGPPPVAPPPGWGGPQGQPPGWGAPQGQPPAWGVPPPVTPPPGWGAPQGQPPAWSGAPSAGWQSPAKKKGRGCTPILVILLLLLAGIGAAYVLIAKPFDGVAGASPTPVARASASPAAPSASARASLLPSTAPATDAPTDGPSAAPTDEPFPTESLSLGDTATCRSEIAGITVTYPAAWVAYEGDPWTCLLFDPSPITVVSDSELPMVAVAIFVDTRGYEAVKADFADTTVYTIVDSGEGEVDTLPAIAYEVESTGNGYYEKGTHEMIVLVDRGADGTLILETVGTPGDAFDANVEVLGQMVQVLQVD